MPNYKKHLVGGFVTYLILLYCVTSFKVSLFNSIQFLLSSLIGSLFPDVDTKSKIQKLFYITLLLLFIVLTIKNHNNLFIIFSFIGITPLIVDHRGIFHKAWFIVLIGLIASSIAITFYPNNSSTIILNIIFFVIGALSHLLLDLGPKKMFRV